MQKSVLILIPAYNESNSIASVLTRLQDPSIATFADVLVVNDASLDNTSEIAKAHGAAVISHVYNLGYGSALQVGYKYAVRNGYQYVIQMDADGQHDVCNIPVIYEKLQTSNEKGSFPDIVLGSRFLPGSQSFPMSGLKMIAIGFFRRAILLFTHRQLLDPTSGLQGLSRSAFLYYSRYGRFDNQYPDANMLIQMMLLDFQVEEIPAVMHARTEGKSMHFGIIEPAYYMMVMVLSVIHTYYRHRFHLLPPKDILFHQD